MSMSRLIFWFTSRLRSPSTWTFRSTYVRISPTSPSARSRTFVFGSTPVSSRIFFAVERPIPYTYVSPTSTLFSRGRSTPAMRAISALPLLVAGVRADHTHHPTPTYHFAPLADGFHARPYLQNRFLLLAFSASYL